MSPSRYNLARTFRCFGKRSKTVYLVRHTESESNVNFSIYKTHADKDVSLTKLGLHQSAFVADFFGQELQNKKDAVFWVSPYLRTRQTARAILQNPQVRAHHIIEDTSLVEMNFGLFYGDNWKKWLTMKDGLNHFEENIFNHIANEKQKQKFFFQMLGGESACDVHQRVKTVAMQILGSKYQTHVVIGHGVSTKCLVMKLLRYSHDWYDNTPLFPNGGVYKLTLDEDFGFVYPGFKRNSIQLDDITKMNLVLRESRELQKRVHQQFYGDYYVNKFF